MKSAAIARDKPDAGFTLSRSIIEPFLALSAKRNLRETAYKAFIARGENGGETDNRSIVTETLAQQEKASFWAMRIMLLETRAHNGWSC